MADEEAIARGDELVEEIFGRDRFNATRRDAPDNNRRDLIRIADEVIFGRTYTRPGLTLQQRSLCTIAALTVLGQLPQLKAHVQGALHLGVEPQAIVEVVRQMAFYGGFPAALNAMEVVDGCLPVEGS